MDMQKVRDDYVSELVRGFLQDQTSYHRRAAEAAETALLDVAIFRKWAHEGEDADSRAMWNKWADGNPKEALDPLRWDRERLERRERELMKWLETPLVWLRTTLRTYADVYHLDPNCGHLIFSPVPLLEGQAKARGMRACSRGACLAHARRMDQVRSAGVD